MKETSSQRYTVIDITKAIGIISIIIGHSAGNLPLTGIHLGKFVYLYHLMVFFFCSGFCFNEEKYKKSGFTSLCGKKVINTGWIFFKYNLFFVAIHNILSSSGFITAAPYLRREMMIHIANGLVFTTNESMLGAFWFLFVYLLAIVLFAAAFFAADRVKEFVALKSSGSIIRKEKEGKTSLLSTAVMIAFMIFFAITGIYFNTKEVYLSFHIQTAFLAVPVLYLGWLAKKYYSKAEPFLGFPSLIISAVLLYLCCYQFGIQIELSVNLLGKWYLFYPISILGIIFCLSLAKVLMKWKFVSNMMRFIGKRTFHYMALHFFVFKLIDNIIGRINNDPIEVFSKFPTAYKLGLTYTVVSVAVISMILIFYERIKKKLCEEKTGKI